MVAEDQRIGMHTPQEGWNRGKDRSSTTRYAWSCLCGVISTPTLQRQGTQLLSIRSGRCARREGFGDRPPANGRFECENIVDKRSGTARAWPSPLPMVDDDECYA